MENLKQVINGTSYVLVEYDIPACGLDDFSDHLEGFQCITQSADIKEKKVSGNVITHFKILVPESELDNFMKYDESEEDNSQPFYLPKYTLIHLAVVILGWFGCFLLYKFMKNNSYFDIVFTVMFFITAMITLIFAIKFFSRIFFSFYQN